jgi:hypothetical protein
LGDGRADPARVAGALILALTALFTAVGVERALAAIDPSREARGTVLAAFAFGLSPEAAQNLTAIAAILVLAASLLGAVLGVGVLLRREAVRHAAIGTFAVFAAVMLPLSIAGVLSGRPTGTTWVALGVGIADAVIVYLLSKPETKRAFELADRSRQRRSERRRAAAASRTSPTA